MTQKYRDLAFLLLGRRMAGTSTTTTTGGLLKMDENLLSYEHMDEEEEEEELLESSVSGHPHSLINSTITTKPSSFPIVSSLTHSGSFNSSRAGVLQPILIYKLRWFILFIFSMNTMMNGLLFMSLSSINNIAVQYYDVHPDRVEWLSNMFMLVYIILALPASYCMMRFGIRPLIITASFSHFISTLLHYFSSHRNGFWLVLMGQGFASLGYCMLIQIPGKLSSLWFPESEAATATSIGAFMNLFGVGLGFLQPSIMVEESPNLSDIEKDLKLFYTSRLIMSGIILLITFIYKEKPPTPPCYNSDRYVPTFTESLRLLWRDKHFVVFAQSYGIYFGLFVTFSILVNPLITSKYTEGYDERLGWMGFWSDMAAIVSCFLIGLTIDKFHTHQLTAILLNAMSMLVWLSFIIVLTTLDQFTVLYILYVFLGVFGVPWFAAGLEQSAEMTYPVSEETSSTVILILGNAYGFVFIFTLGYAAELGYLKVVGYCMVGLYFISTVLASFAKTQLKRILAEKEASSRFTNSITLGSVLSGKVDSWI